MTVAKSERVVISGGADSTIKLWRDITDETVAKQRIEEESKMQKEQEMSNLLEMKQYDKAVELAIVLNHPRRALKVFEQILNTPPSSSSSSGTNNVLQDVVSGLATSYLESLLGYVCEW